MSLNHRVNNVANGRRIGTRKLVMNTPATVHAQVWSKRVVYANDDQNVPHDPLSFESISTSKQDEPNYAYDEKGFACLLFDKFAGGIVHKNYGDNIPTDQTLLSQIEPYNADLESIEEQVLNIPDWHIADGDLLGLMIYDGFIVWYEVVGFTGQTVMTDFGMKYILNRRDELVLDPIKQEVNSRG